MSIFVDKKFESMDWISQATEPYELEMDKVYCDLPDEYVLSMQDIQIPSWNMTNVYANKDDILRKLIGVSRLNRLSHGEVTAICTYYEFHCSSEVAVDISANLIIGEIKLVKKYNSVPEEAAKQVIKTAVFDAVSRLDLRNAPKERMMDVANIVLDKDEDYNVFAKPGMSGTKMSAFKTCLTNTLVLLDRFRSDLVAKQFVQVIENYLVLNDPQYLGEILRITRMMRSGQAIYTLSEKMLQGGSDARR